MDIHVSIDDIRAILPDARIVGDDSKTVTGFASMEDATPNDLAFVTGAKNISKISESHAGIILVVPSVKLLPAQGQTFVLTTDPSLAMAKICEVIEKRLRPNPPAGIHHTACIEVSAKVSSSASIGPFCYVGAESVIGDNVVLEAGVKIGIRAKIGADSHLYQNVVVGDYCEIGCRAIFHPGVAIGGDGFGFIQTGKLPDVIHYKVPQIGIVVIEDDVEIGANSTVDRARFGQTRVGQGSKIDNLVQIGHNSIIGKRCIFCAQAGVAGSTTIGDYVVMWGQSGTVGHLTVGDFAFIGGQAGVTKDVPAHAKITGSPARPIFEVRKSESALAMLPDTLARMNKLLGERGEAPDTNKV